MVTSGSAILLCRSPIQIERSKRDRDVNSNNSTKKSAPFQVSIVSSNHSISTHTVYRELNKSNVCFTLSVAIRILSCRENQLEVKRKHMPTGRGRQAAEHQNRISNVSSQTRSKDEGRDGRVIEDTSSFSPKTLQAGSYVNKDSSGSEMSGS